MKSPGEQLLKEKWSGEKNRTFGNSYILDVFDCILHELPQYFYSHIFSRFLPFLYQEVESISLPLQSQWAFVIT